MNLLSAEAISKAFSERWLFKNISFGLQQGEKIALVGANGTGKTTLLKTLAGQIPPDGGEVTLRKGIRAEYLDQQPTPDPNLTVEQTIFDDSNEIAKVVNAYEHAILQPDYPAEKMQHLLEQMEELQAWDFENQVKQVLSKLSITDLDQKIGSLSGGQRKRVALARLVLSAPDLILLDEPTNHLDLQAIEWLETYLGSANVTLLMVTHDRYFLDNVTTSIVELDGGQLFKYEGNYAYYLEKKADRMEILQAGIDKARNLYTKELEWMRRQPKARGTKAKYRQDAFEDIKEKAFMTIRKDTLELQVKVSRQGGNVLELDDVSKAFGPKTILENFSYTFRKKEKVGLVGKNGIGKSTFLDMITGKTMPDSGEVIPGQTTRIGYYTQEIDNLNVENRIIDEVKEIAEYVPLADGTEISVSKLLEMFLFPPKVQYGLIGKLSGGERRRLQLLKILVANPNFLILDEPTNDLDIDTLNVLEQFLVDFQGCLMLVSHDRYFMDQLVEHLFVFEGDGVIKDFPGNYTDYRDWADAKAEAEQAAKANAPKAKATTPAPAVAAATTPEKRKLNNKEQREYDGIEKEIANLEQEKADLIEKLNPGTATFDTISIISKRIEAIDTELDTKTTRWLELGE